MRGRRAQPAHVAVEEERLAVVGAQRLVDALAVQEPVIEDRDDRVLLVGHAPVDVHRRCASHSRRGRRERWPCRQCRLPAAIRSNDRRLARCRSASSMRVLNAAQMREADRRTIEEIGIPSLVLMENAGRQVVAAMEAAFERSAASSRSRVLCGRGNNGGDGFVVARTLMQRGVDVVGVPDRPRRRRPRRRAHQPRDPRPPRPHRRRDRRRAGVGAALLRGRRLRRSSSTRSSAPASTRR